MRFAYLQQMTLAGLLGLSMIATGMTAGPALAQQAGTFDLELNNLEPADGGCRLTFVAHNATGTDLSLTSFDVAVFDGGGTVSDRLILEFGRLPQDKTRVVQFLLNRGCAEISRLLINDSEECVSAAGGESRICTDALVSSSRASIQFGS